MSERGTDAARVVKREKEAPLRAFASAAPVALHFSDGTEASFDMVVFCDGSASRSRRRVSRPRSTFWMRIAAKRVSANSVFSSLPRHAACRVTTARA